VLKLVFASSCSLSPVGKRPPAAERLPSAETGVCVRCWNWCSHCSLSPVGERAGG